MFRILLLAVCLLAVGAIAATEPARAVGSRWDPNGVPDIDGP